MLKRKAGYVKLDTRDDFERWVKKGGWKNVKEFEKDTCVRVTTLYGTYFQVVHNRVYILGREDALN